MAVHKRASEDAEGAEAFRRLVAGTAHDINNLLLLISGCAELALMDEALSPHTRQLMREIVDAGERAAALTRRFLALDKPPVLRPPTVDVAALLMSSTTLFGRLVGEDIRLNLDVGAAPLWVRADPSQLEQVIVNLVLNARDAMAAGGTLTITAAEMAGSSSGSRFDAGFGQERAARLTVSDTGGGIDPSIVGRMYEPYVTTKTSQKHSGLGLAVVRGIVDQLGGSIDVTTADTGTTFAIALPLARVPDEPA